MLSVGGHHRCVVSELLCLDYSQVDPIYLKDLLQLLYILQGRPPHYRHGQDRKGFQGRV